MILPMIPEIAIMQRIIVHILIPKGIPPSPPAVEIYHTWRMGTPPIAEILCVKNGRAIVVCGFAGNSQTAPMIFFSNFQYMFFFNYFIKNPKITIALLFLTHNISAIGGVLLYIVAFEYTNDGWGALIEKNGYTL